MNYKKLCKSIFFSLALLMPFAPAQAGLWDYAKSALSVPVNYPRTTAVAAGAALLYFKGPDLYNAAKAKVNEKIDAFKNSPSMQLAAAGVVAAGLGTYYLSKSPTVSTGLAGTAAFLLSLRDGKTPPAPQLPQSNVAAPVTVINNYYGFVSQSNPSHIPSTRMNDDGTMEDTSSAPQRASGWVASALDAYGLAKMTVGQFVENNPTMAKAAKVAAGVAGVAVVATAGYQLANRFAAPSAPQAMAMSAHIPTLGAQQKQPTLIDEIEQNARAQARREIIKAREEKEQREMAQLAEEHLEYLDKKEQNDTRKFVPASCTIS
jgi:hypothetical protein